MFSQRKSFWKRRWFVFVVIALISIGYWINQSGNNEIQEPNDHMTGLNTDSDANINKDVGKQTFNDEDEGSEDIIDEQSQDLPYYLLRATDQYIAIYYYDENGEESFVRNTDIAYSLLSETDQKLFDNGIIVKTEEELQELLQDFGS